MKGKIRKSLMFIFGLVIMSLFVFGVNVFNTNNLFTVDDTGNVKTNGTISTYSTDEVALNLTRNSNAGTSIELGNNQNKVYIGITGGENFGISTTSDITTGQTFTHLRANGYTGFNGITNPVAPVDILCTSASCLDIQQATTGQSQLNFKNNTGNDAFGIIRENNNDLLFYSYLDSTNNAEITNDGKFYVRDLTAPGSDPMCWDGAGASYIGDCSSLSEYKDNITYLNPSYTWLTNKYLQLAPASYTWKENYVSESGDGVYDKTEYGLLADEVVNIHPALVGYNEEGKVKNVRWFNLITFNVLMIKSIIEKQIEQEARLDSIEADLCTQGLTKYC